MVPMIRKVIALPVAVSHYSIGTVLVLSHFVRCGVEAHRRALT